MPWKAIYYGFFICAGMYSATGLPNFLAGVSVLGTILGIGLVCDFID